MRTHPLFELFDSLDLLPLSQDEFLDPLILYLSLLVLRLSFFYYLTLNIAKGLLYSSFLNELFVRLLLSYFFDEGIESVFDLIFRPSRDVLGYHRPLIPNSLLFL